MNLMDACLVGVLIFGPAGDDKPGTWGQFRGPGGGAVAVGRAALPTEIGPKEYLAWKTPLPPGLSSPVIHGDRIFLTAVHDKKLFTIGLDRKTGREVWRTETPHRGLEKIHKIGSQAQATPATDGDNVVASSARPASSVTTGPARSAGGCRWGRSPPNSAPRPPP
jgi:hypothetical protein